jgi:hypothetical protein
VLEGRRPSSTRRRALFSSLSLLSSPSAIHTERDGQSSSSQSQVQSSRTSPCVISHTPARTQKRRAVDDDEQEEQDEQTDYDSNDSGGGARSNKRKKTTVGKRAPAKSQSKNKGKGKGKKRADSDEEDDDSDDGDDSSDSDRDGQAGKGKKGDLTEEASSPLARNTSNNLLTPRPPAREQEKKFYIQGMVRWILFNESHRRVLRRQDIVKAGQSLLRGYSVHPRNEY